MFHIYIYIEHLGFCLPSLAAEIRPGVRAIYPDPQVGAQHTLPGTSFFPLFFSVLVFRFYNSFSLVSLKN